jgi:hypothetical protein
VVRQPSRYDDASDFEGLDPALLEALDKLIRRALAEQHLSPRTRLIKHGSIFRNNIVEQAKVGTHFDKIVESPTGYENRATTGCSQAFDCCDGRVQKRAVAGDDTVIVCDES